MGKSDFHHRVDLPQKVSYRLAYSTPACGPRQRWISQVPDVSVSRRAVLLDPAAVSSMRISRKEGQRFTARRSMVSHHVGPQLVKQDVVNFLSETIIRQWLVF
jgi:hypothetical protein